MNVMPLDQVSYENLAALVNTGFRVRWDPKQSVDMKLVELSPRKIAATGGAKPVSYESFTLVFLGPAAQVLPQQIYVFEAAGFGRFEMFIVPIGSDTGGTRYQAVFNRVAVPA